MRLTFVTIALLLPACGDGATKQRDAASDLDADVAFDAMPVAHRDPHFWPHASDSPWNLGIGSTAEYAPEDSAIATSLHDDAPPTASPGIIYSQFSYPIVLASDADPLETIAVGVCFVDGGAGGSAGTCNTQTKTFQARIPAAAQVDASPEGHMPVTQPDGTTQLQGYSWTGGPGTWRAARLTVWDLRGTGFSAQPGQQWGTRASGTSDIAGLMRCWELEKLLAGEWDAFPHALALAILGTQLAQAPTIGGTYAWPATSADGGWANYRGKVPMGALLAIPPATARPTLRNKLSEAIWNTFVRYGAYVVDQSGGPFALYAEPTCSAEVRAALAETQSFDRALATRDLYKMWKAATAVTNNTPTSINGGGSYAQPPAPPLVPNLGAPYDGSFTP